MPSTPDPWTDAVLPTKLLEYATVGIPAITFRNPVIDSVFTANEVTFADPATPDTLHRAMLAMVRDVEGVRRQAEAATKVVEAIAWQQQKQVYLGQRSPLLIRPGRAAPDR